MNLNTQDRFKRTPLHWAARFGNEKVALLLLQLGADHKLVDGES
jgi:ankyrin repeat protein